MFSLSSLTRTEIKDNILSGLLVALALVPESVAFAFVAGVEPLVALYGAAIVCIITSLIGGRHGLISAATAPIAVMMAPLVRVHGVEYMFAAVALMGVIQITLSQLKLGKFVRMVPYSVLLGFLNGLAIIIFLAQFSQFETLNVLGEIIPMAGMELFTMAGLVALTMVIIFLFPKISKAIPSPLVAIVAIAAVLWLSPLDSPTVADKAGIAGAFPSFQIPDVPGTFAMFKTILPFSIIFALIGFIHSLMSMSVVDEMTESRGDGNRVVLGQGVANLVTGFFGGMGGTTMIGQTIININAKGRHHLSGLVAGILLLLFIVVLSPLIEHIPIAALVGIMFMVVIGTFSWSSMQIIHKVPRMDAIVMVITAAMIVFTNVAYAVIVGIILAALEFAWKKSQKINVTRKEINKVVTYNVDGPLFFASTTNFQSQFDPKKDANKKVIIDFAQSRIYDHSAVEEINKLIDRYKKVGAELHLQHVNEETKTLLRHAAEFFDTDEENDPRYHLVVDPVVFAK